MHPISFRLRQLSGRVLTALVVALPGLSALAQTGSTPLIWEARSATNTVYLFGTIHVGAPKMYPLSPVAEQAFAESKVLALEADPTDPTAVTAAAAGAIYPPPDNLAKHISAPLMEQVVKALPSLGLPIEYARAMRPTLLAMTIAMIEVTRQGYDPSLGLDLYFAQKAKKDGKRIVELESVEEQLTLLNNFSPALQEGMLQAALDSIGDGTLAIELRDLVAAWIAGDPKQLSTQVDKDTANLPHGLAKEYEERLYLSRNRVMADKIAVLLDDNTPAFVAVGAAHLLGPQSIVELLRVRGYRIRQR